MINNQMSFYIRTSYKMTIGDETNDKGKTDNTTGLVFGKRRVTSNAYNIHHTKYISTIEVP